MADSSRAAALAALRDLGVKDTGANTVEEPKVERSGNEVPAGGDVARLLVKPAHLTYRQDGELRYPEAGVGDVVLLTAAAAKRLDELGATVDPDATEEEVEAATDGEVTDEQLRAMSAGDLVAHVGQHPEHKGRVRDLELERDADKQRVTVLKATEASDDEDEELDEDEA